MSPSREFYRFTISYKGQKASAFVQGATPDEDMCQSFKHDLTCLGVNLPKAEDIHIHAHGSISLIFTRHLNNKPNSVGTRVVCLFSPHTDLNIRKYWNVMRKWCLVKMPLIILPPPRSSSLCKLILIACIGCDMLKSV